MRYSYFERLNHPSYNPMKSKNDPNFEKNGPSRQSTISDNLYCLENKLGLGEETIPTNKSKRCYFLLADCKLWCKASQNDLEYEWCLDLSFVKLFKPQTSNSTKMESKQSYSSSQDEGNDARGFTFTLYYGAVYWKILCGSENQCKEWVNLLSKMCINTDIHTYYKVIKVVRTTNRKRKVCHAVDTRTKKKFLVKGYNKSSKELTQEDGIAVMKEIITSRAIAPHQNIMSLVDVQETESSIYLIYECMNGGSLKEIFQDSSDSHCLSFSEVIHIMTGILRGIDHLSKDFSYINQGFSSILLKNGRVNGPEDVKLYKFSELQPKRKNTDPYNPQNQNSNDGATVNVEGFNCDLMKNLGYLFLSLIVGQLITKSKFMRLSEMNTRQNVLDSIESRSAKYGDKNFQVPSQVVELIARMIDNSENDEDEGKIARKVLLTILLTMNKQKQARRDLSVGTEEIKNCDMEDETSKRSAVSRSISVKKPMANLSKTSKANYPWDSSLLKTLISNKEPLSASIKRMGIIKRKSDSNNHYQLSLKRKSILGENSFCNSLIQRSKRNLKTPDQKVTSSFNNSLLQDQSGNLFDTQLGFLTPKLKKKQVNTGSSRFMVLPNNTLKFIRQPSTRSNTNMMNPGSKLLNF